MTTSPVYVTTPLRVITEVEGKAIFVGQTKYRGDFVNLEFDLMEPPK